MHGYEGVTLACDDDKQIQGTYGVMWGDTVDDYDWVTLACDDDKQIQGTLEVMWGILWKITVGLLLLVMTINGFR